MIFIAFTNIVYAILSLIVTACFLLYVNSKGKPDFLLTVLVWIKTPKKFTIFNAKPISHPFFTEEKNEL